MSGPKESLHSYTPKISFLVYTIKDKCLYTCYDSQFTVSICHGLWETPPTIHLMQLLPEKVAFDFSPTIQPLVPFTPPSVCICLSS